MTLTIKDTPPVHPPRRRTIEGELKGLQVRATALSHYDTETNAYGPFELADNITISKDGYALLAARANQISTLFEIVGELVAKAAEPAAEVTA